MQIVTRVSQTRSQDYALERQNLSVRIAKRSQRFMKRILSAGVVAVFLAAGIACSRGHRAEHATEEKAAPELPPPTPDTTPIPLLRTPAGLVLGVEGTPAPAAPSPAGTPVSAPTPTPPVS
jgi:hypothetical protein